MSCNRKIGPFDCCSVVCGNCLELMKLLPDGCVDAVITDPPYGIGFAYDSHDDSPSNYGAFVWSACSLAERLCSPGSPFFVWQAMLNVRQFAEWFPRDFRIFAAAKNFVQMRPTPMQYSFDPVLVWWTPGMPWFAGTSSRDFHIGNTANTLNRKDGDASGHPCARPLDQLEHIIEQWVRPDGIAFDPFLGSGTTAVAAKKLGRHFLGFEISEQYCQIARERLARIDAQPSLFKPKAEQLALA